MFFQCSRLNNVVIPNTVTHIGAYAFGSCSSLLSLTVPGSVNAITTSALAQCSGVTNIVLLSGVTTLRYDAIAYCSNLVMVVLPNTVSSIDIYAFEQCPKLKALYFRGNAPTVAGTAFPGTTNAVVYYLPGTSGWGATFGGVPTALWVPVIQTGDSNFGIRNNAFGFNVAWASGQTIRVEACSDMASPVWIPVSTNVLSADSFYVTDVTWTNFSRRFYRIRWF
jgi:hypothetical protein